MVTAGRIARLARRCGAALGGDLAGWRAAVRGLGGPRLLRYDLRPPGGTRTVHLRLHADGSGVLLVDATDAVHLNATAALMARLALDGVPRAQCVKLIRRRFRGADPSSVARDAREVYGLVDRIRTTADACPTCGLESALRAPLFSVPVHAPLKADLALTYACNNRCRHCYNPPERKTMRRLTTAGWRRVLRTLVRIGVPQVIFTGGEPTLADDLAGLVGYAARLGLVAGLNTNGRRLAEGGYAGALARVGLSHVQITLESHVPSVHDSMTGAASFAETVGGIRSALGAGLHTITNTTLTRQNAGDPDALVDFLHDLGLQTFAVNGMIHSGCGRDNREALAEERLGPILVALRGRAADLGMRMLWYTPTAYCRLSPAELELGPRRCNAGEYSMCIEPNGDVLPCQSYYRPAGNLLRDPWEQIWDGPLFRSFRDRTRDPRGCGLPQACWTCPDLPLCAGGCRLQRERTGVSGGAAATAGLSSSAEHESGQSNRGARPTARSI